MANNQMFFALVGVMGVFAGFAKYYLDAKIDGVDNKLGAKLDGLAKQVDLLVHYMIEHEGRIARLEERTK